MKFVWISLLLVALLAGCTPRAQPALLPPTLAPSANPVVVAPAPSATSLPTATHTPAPAAMPATATPLPPPATPLPTATAAPTHTARPTDTQTPSLTATPARPSFTVKSGNATVNVRLGPGTNYPVVGQAQAGQTYQISGRNAAADWWEFSYGDGVHKGWVSDTVVTVNELAPGVKVALDIPPSPTPAPTFTPSPAPATATRPASGASCPSWFRWPEPGMGVLVVENHAWGTGLDLFEEIGVPGDYRIPEKHNDVPGRLVFQLKPGKHTFKPADEHIFDAYVEAGKIYVVPVGTIQTFCTGWPYTCRGQGAQYYTTYPMEPPPGC